MNGRLRMRNGCSVAGLALLALIPLAPLRAEVDPGIVEAIRSHRLDLQKFTWESKTVVREDGKVRREMKYRVGFDEEGRLIRTPVGNGGPEPGEESERLRSPLSMEAGEVGEELRELIDEYLHPSRETLSEFLRKAEQKDGVGRARELTRIRGGDFLMPEDSVSLWVETGTNRFEMLEIRTFLKGNPVAVRALYLNVTGAPSFPHRTVIFLPVRKMEVTTHNTDPVRTGGDGPGGS